MIALITGPSGSGKTKRLFKSIANARKYSQRYILIRPWANIPGYEPTDLSFGNTDLEINANLLIYGMDELPDEDDYHFIFVDDVHLMTVDEVKSLLETVEPKTRNLVFYGPNEDYAGTPFESVQYLIDGEGDYVDYVEFLEVLCRQCNKKVATKTQRYINKAPAGWSPRIYLDKAVTYEPVCENCWQNPLRIDFQS